MNKRRLTGARAVWYTYYRIIRIARREWAKAFEDTILYGSGAVLFTNDQDICRHVPIADITLGELP